MPNIQIGDVVKVIAEDRQLRGLNCTGAIRTGEVYRVTGSSDHNLELNGFQRGWVRRGWVHLVEKGKQPEQPEQPFEVDDEVLLRKTSFYYGGEAQGEGSIGTITHYVDEDHGITVQWSNGDWNAYNPEDLELYEEL